MLSHIEPGAKHTHAIVIRPIVVLLDVGILSVPRPMVIFVESRFFVVVEKRFWKTRIVALAYKTIFCRTLIVDRKI